MSRLSDMNISDPGARVLAVSGDAGGDGAAWAATAAMPDRPAEQASRFMAVIAVVGAVLGASNFFVADVLRPGTPTIVYAAMMAMLALIGIGLWVLRSASSSLITVLVLASLPIYLTVCWTMQDASAFASPIMMLFGAVMAALLLEWWAVVVQGVLLCAGTAYALSSTWTESTRGLVAQIIVQSGIMLCSAGILYAMRRHTERAYDRAWRASHLDSLTGLLNRGALGEAMPASAERAAGRGERLAVVVLDLDHFKAINDTHGHDTGDRVLVAAADALRTVVSADGLICRLGGEEFAIVQPVAGDDAGEELGMRVLGAVRAIREPCPVTCSTGVMVADPPVGRNAVDWLWQQVSHADDAMYEAKRTGRDRLRIRAATVEPADGA